MNISNKRKRRYKYLYVNHMSNMRSTYKVTGCIFYDANNNSTYTIINNDNKE